MWKLLLVSTNQLQINHLHSSFFKTLTPRKNKNNNNKKTLKEIRLLQIKRANNLVQNDLTHINAVAERIQNWQEAFNLHNE